MATYIDATPSWPAAAKMLQAILENNPDQREKALAWAEINRMAIMAQAWCDYCTQALRKEKL